MLLPRAARNFRVEPAEVCGDEFALPAQLSRGVFHHGQH
jgi:hypothetical protein